MQRVLCNCLKHGVFDAKRCLTAEVSTEIKVQYSPGYVVCVCLCVRERGVGGGVTVCSSSVRVSWLAEACRGTS